MAGMGISEKYVDRLGHASFMDETNATARRVKHTDFAANEAMVRGRDGWKWLGYFDGNPQHNSLGKDIDIFTNENIELATEAAREATVLLKNENDALPSSSDKIKTLAVAGPSPNATDAMVGNYAEVPCRMILGLSEYAEVLCIGEKPRLKLPLKLPFSPHPASMKPQYAEVFGEALQLAYDSV
ncbi:hypothetical protein DKX38_028686 [Salix brachista]|uniref:Glycoside hydrolase family 3 C-terminal domain-containing protein n=1 Tax=Salix brachista TaxID=2182728 RepID=A0A5N5J9Q9_9ROSI|nr:hypothetical protein DKX38_028686 [Salix brachista]